MACTHCTKRVFPVPEVVLFRKYHLCNRPLYPIYIVILSQQNHPSYTLSPIHTLFQNVTSPYTLSGLQSVMSYSLYLLAGSRWGWSLPTPTVEVITLPNGQCSQCTMVPAASACYD